MRINVGGAGQTANRMFRYMYCRNLQALLPGSELFGYSIPEFGLSRPASPLEGKILTVERGHFHPIGPLAHRIVTEGYDGLAFNAFAMRLEYYPDRAACAGYFRAPTPPPNGPRDAGHLTIHVRAGDILSKPHRDYNPVPIAFFEQIVEQTGLTPVFVGQFGQDGYTRAIRERFPKALYRLGGSVLEDFEFIRHSTNILCSVSSFAWLAAWLSPTATTIHLPVSGFFNPRQRPDVDLLPNDDARYRFYDFPTFVWKATPAQQDALLARGSRFAPLTAEAVAALRAGPPR